MKYQTISSEYMGYLVTNNFSLFRNVQKGTDSCKVSCTDVGQYAHWEESQAQEDWKSY